MIAIFKGERRRLFATLLAVAIFHSSTAAFFAWCIHHLFDGLHVGGPNPVFDMPLLVGAALSAALLACVLEIIQRRLTEGMGYSYAGDVRLALFRHLLRLPPRAVRARRHGALLLPFVGDLTSIRQWVSDGLARMIVATATILILLVWLALSSVLLACVLGGLLGVFVVAGLVLARPMDRAVRDVRRRRGAVSAFVSGRLAAIATIVTMGRQKTESRKLADRNEALTAASLRRSWAVGGMRGLVHLSTSLLVLATLLVGMREVGTGRMTAGGVVGAMSLVALLGRAIRDLGRALELWIPGRVAKERIDWLMSLPIRSRPRHRGPAPSALPDGLRFENICVGSVFAMITAQATPGDVVLVKGAAGSGKSALIGLIAGLVEAESGLVLFNGRTLSSLSVDEFRRTIGFASPLLPLLPGSIGMNLRYRAPQETARAATDLLGIGVAVGTALENLDQSLPNRGGDLSTGDYQALTIARAMLGTPPILLLDSIDTHLATDVAAKLATRVSNYPGIVIMTASQDALIASANRIWELEGGKLHVSSQDRQPGPVPLSLVKGAGIVGAG
jgi:ABC-type bacteriocin/lantibiotic exporter with double-glycine peptidase domain